MLKLFVQEYEYAINTIYPACTIAASKHIMQNLTICDLKGESTSLINAKVIGFIKKTSSIAQNYYPEMLGQMLIINTTPLFRGVWAIVKGFLDDKTTKKITVLGEHDYTQELLKYVI